MMNIDAIIGLTHELVDEKRPLEEIVPFFEQELQPAVMRSPQRLDIQSCFVKMMLYIDEWHNPDDPTYEIHAIQFLQDLLDRFPTWWLGWWYAGLAIRGLEFNLGLSCVCQALLYAPLAADEDWLLAETEIYFRAEEIPRLFFSSIHFWQEGAWLSSEFLTYGN